MESPCEVELVSVDPLRTPKLEDLSDEGGLLDVPVPPLRIPKLEVLPEASEPLAAHNQYWHSAMLSKCLYEAVTS